MKRQAPSREDSAARYLVRAALLLALLGMLATTLWQPLVGAFLASRYLNGVIAVLFAFGVVFALRCLWLAQREALALGFVARLAAETRRGERSLAEFGELVTTPALGPIGAFLGTVRRVLKEGETTATLPYLLDALAARGEDRRALVRYLCTALILIGLIGTFYGLLVTIDGVRGVIGGLGGGEAGAWLDALRERLAVPLAGMGTGFATSLFGLVTSLSLAFLELQMFHAQNEVDTRLETLVIAELAPLWQAPAVAVAAGAGPAPPRYLAALAEAVVERLDRVAALLEASARRDDAGRVQSQVSRLEERIQALQQGVADIERERTAELRHQLKVIGRYMARGGSDGDAPPQ